MLSLIAKYVRDIKSNQGNRSHALEMTQEFAKFIPSFKGNDLAILLFIALSSNEYGCAALSAADIASRFSMSDASVFEALARLSRTRLETRRLIFVGHANNKETSLFQIVLPTDEELDKMPKKVKELK